MGHVEVVGGTFAGIAAAVRLARVGHHVTMVVTDPDWAARLRAELGDGALVFPAPWRDLLKKSGRPAAGAFGRRGWQLVPDTPGPPTDRGDRWYADREELGTEAADAWRACVDASDDLWQTLRPLGVEAELTPDGVAAAALDPRRSLADIAHTLPHAALRQRVVAVAADQAIDAVDAPAWLASRLSVTRTFGRWRLIDAHQAPLPAGALVDVLTDRLAERDVNVHSTRVGGDVTINTVDPELRWHRPRPFRRQDSFVDQLLTRPRMRTADPSIFHASASSPAGPEPWAQILSGALASYAAHARLTGEDIRPIKRTTHERGL